jgi:TrmH family RNA methyltransferase
MLILPAFTVSDYRDMQTITSFHNDTYRLWLSLTSAKGLKKEGLFLLSGAKLITEFLAKPDLAVHAEIVKTGMNPVTHDANKHFQLSPELFAEIDVLGTHHNILVLEQPPMAVIEDQALASYAPRGLEVVLPVGDPGNLGALIRSCEAFGVPRVILTREAAHPFLPKSVKASAGSVLRMPMLTAPTLKEFPANCIALDMQGTPLRYFDWPVNGLLVVGEEGQGLGSSRFKQRVCIPTKGVESLNVVVAASIALARSAEK